MSFFFQAEDGIRDPLVTGVQTCALPISRLLHLQVDPGMRVHPLDLRDLAPQHQGAVGIEFGGKRMVSGDRHGHGGDDRSEERRVGKEWRCRWSPWYEKEKERVTRATMYD